ncbi:MAG TPA: CocE/NonD family hydrolase [Arenimonas sp.]|uniref:CocE/NonD family hydrolase n=1 Tax=Arenimonas sp. TaxID=1872635 RepID=UPI002C5B7A71|nr:CocE/NonD family hydrolase [Arenimonas sp.]HMB56716.1 CocE/NonD family hydrolase [Arenimonas sp.]
MLKALCLALLCLLASGYASAQQIDFTATAEQDDAALAPAMKALAGRTLAIYREDNHDTYLNKLFRLQTIAGDDDQAVRTIQQLRELRRNGNAAQSNALFVQYEIYARAEKLADDRHLPLADAFVQAFRDVYGRLDDKTALQAVFSFHADLDQARADFGKALAQQRGRHFIALADALELVRKYHFLRAYETLLPHTDALVAEDDHRRYLIDDQVLITMPDGAHVAAMLVRPRSVGTTLPTLFEFTIYSVDLWGITDAKKSAAYGYAGVVAYTRGKGRSPDPVVPYEHDGEDAAAVIDWISKQPWSDGRVGMYGGSYNGFAAWAAAKHHPPALKAIMDSATTAPGIDVPMQGGVFLNFLYPWVPYTTNNKALDDATYNDQARWTRLNRSWYASGQAYRSLDRIDGTPSPVFRRWLDHPSYDAYWQRMIPYREEFAGIDIPVLTTTGYYDGGMVGALYYLNQHLRYNPRADHSLVIGPYDHFVMQNGVARNLLGYDIDPAASIDLPELRYQWFDYLFKGGKKPELLQDRINYQVMGANEWKHAPTLATMANSVLRFHLTDDQVGDQRRLDAARPPRGAVIEQSVDFGDRSNIDYASPPLLINRSVDSNNGLVFLSDPMTQATEFSGLFSGRLDFSIDKRDVDYNLALYELLPSGEYLQLSSHIGRASFARDRSHRSLLTPGKRQSLTFTSERMTSRQLQPGSRLVLVLSVNKQPDIQINYGSGKDVSDETIADGKRPLHLRWYDSSYIDIPVWRQAAPPSAGR